MYIKVPVSPEPLGYDKRKHISHLLQNLPSAQNLRITHKRPAREDPALLSLVLPSQRILFLSESGNLYMINCENK